MYVKDFPEGKKWLPGTISKREGKVTYHISLEDGRVVRRHIDHVRSQTNDSTVQIDSSQDSVNEDILLDIPSSVTPRQEPDKDSSSESSNVELRRSDRIRQPPDRFCYDSWTA